VHGETQLEEGAILDYSAAVRIKGKYDLLFFRIQCRFLYTA